MSYILGIDTSSIELSIGLAHDRQAVMSVSRYVRNSHAEIISSTVAFLLESSNVAPSDIGHIAIAIGPGSFTGLRIGISYIKGFCFQRAIKVLPVSSLACIAAAWHTKEKAVIVACEARNGEVFCARFDPGKNGLVRTMPDQLLPVAVFRTIIIDDALVLTDTLGFAKSSAFDFLSSRADVYPLEHYPIQRGLACALLGGRSLHEPQQWTNAALLVPQYLNVTAIEKKMAQSQTCM
jgi:tRNA threonylcarbamoyladenosine biosynthesis protein TsaB